MKLPVPLTEPPAREPGEAATTRGHVASGETNGDNADLATKDCMLLQPTQPEARQTGPCQRLKPIRMSKTQKTNRPVRLAGPSALSTAGQPDFEVVLGLIEAARRRAVAVANTTLIDLYWNIGEYISRKIAAEEWGRGTVAALAETIQRRYPGVAGYSPQNLWRMRQFFET